LKRFCFVWLFVLSVLPLIHAEDLTVVPPGKGRVIIFADFMVLEAGPVTFQVDKEEEFTFPVSKKNLVLDLVPGRHSFKISFPSVLGGIAYTDIAGFFVADGNLVNLRYKVTGSYSHIYMVTPEKFRSTASARPFAIDPFSGGQQ
jgi:hypothetical protein